MSSIFNPRGIKRPHDGRGNGIGRSGGNRFGQNLGPCFFSGPGFGQGSGRGAGKGRKYWDISAIGRNIS